VLRSFVFADANLPDAVVDLAVRAEAAGFHRVWTTETPSRDAMLRAAAIAMRTSRLRVGTGIAYAFTRAPLAMAAAAAEVQLLSGGRFALGLGSMTRGMRRGWYGLEVDHPAPRLAEYVRFVKAALAAGDGFTFEGRFYRADVPAFRIAGAADLVRSLPIYGSGVNAVMLRTCLAVCDGLALHPLSATPAYLDAVVRPALARGGRAIPMAAWRITAVARDGEAARRAARRTVAFYLSTPSYAGAAAGRSWEGLPNRIQQAFRAAGQPVRWGPIGELVGDDALAELTLAGTPEEVREGALRLEEDLASRGVDEVVFQPASGTEELDSLANQRLIIESLGAG
jgi:alkanesulfonate monooxygenase SsuD/methylene tetrahydromethanopterin reductase-like flavin-dependent oxidoreductase (luciferase family)